MTESKTESNEIDLSHLYRPNNRGNKLRVALLPGTDIISRPSLWPLTPPDEDQDVLLINIDPTIWQTKSDCEKKKESG